MQNHYKFDYHCSENSITYSITQLENASHFIGTVLEGLDRVFDIQPLGSTTYLFVTCWYGVPYKEA